MDVEASNRESQTSIIQPFLARQILGKQNKGADYNTQEEPHNSSMHKRMAEWTDAQEKQVVLCNCEFPDFWLFDQTAKDDLACLSCEESVLLLQCWF